MAAKTACAWRSRSGSSGTSSAAIDRSERTGGGAQLERRDAGLAAHAAAGAGRQRAGRPAPRHQLRVEMHDDDVAALLRPQRLGRGAPHGQGLGRVAQHALGVEQAARQIEIGVRFAGIVDRPGLGADQAGRAHRDRERHPVRVAQLERRLDHDRIEVVAAGAGVAGAPDAHHRAFLDRSLHQASIARRKTGYTRPVKQRVFRDPVHGLIELGGPDRELGPVLETRAFQRLRRLHQMGFASLVYPGAEHSRFGHALGSFHVAQRVTRQLQLAPDVARHVVLAALLHDIGHGPFSHSWEQVAGDIDHEAWGARIVEQDDELRGVLADIDPGLPEALCGFWRKTYRPAFARKLVSSQLDVDRLDYLLRDGHYSGAGYATFDLEWILHALQIQPVHAGDDPDDLVIDYRRGKYAVEQYLFARSYMYAQVYHHKTVRAADWMFLKIMERYRELAAGGLEPPGLEPVARMARGADPGGGRVPVARRRLGDRGDRQLGRARSRLVEPGGARRGTARSFAAPGVAAAVQDHRAWPRRGRHRSSARAGRAGGAGALRRGGTSLCAARQRRADRIPVRGRRGALRHRPSGARHGHARAGCSTTSRSAGRCRQCGCCALRSSSMRSSRSQNVRSATARRLARRGRRRCARDARSTVDHSRLSAPRVSKKRSSTGQVPRRYSPRARGSHLDLKLSTRRDLRGDISARSSLPQFGQLARAHSWHVRCNLPRLFGGRSGTL